MMLKYTLYIQGGGGIAEVALHFNGFQIQQ